MKTVLTVDEVTGSDEWHDGIIHTTSKKRSEPCQTPRIWGRRMKSRKRKRSCPRIHESKRPQFRHSGPLTVEELSWCRADLDECGEGESEHKAQLGGSGQGARFEALSRAKGVNAQAPVPNQRSQPTYFRQPALWFAAVSRAAVSSTAASPIIVRMQRSKEEERKPPM